MVRGIRRKLVASLTEIELKEDFLYNKWLRVQPTEEVSVGIITSQLRDVPDIQYDIPKPIFTEHFFRLNELEIYPEDKKHIFRKISTNPVFFQLLYIPSKVLHHVDIEPRPAGYTAKQIKFLFSSVSQQEFRVKFNLPVPTEYSLLLDTPVITDHLENLKTKIRNIELLKPEELIHDAGKQTIDEYEVKSFGKLKVSKLKVERIDKAPKLSQVKVPEMGKYKSTISAVKINVLKRSAISRSPRLEFNIPSVSIGKYYFEQTESVKYYDGVERELTSDKAVKTDYLKKPGEIKDVISLVLKNTYKVEWEKRNDNHIILSETEDECAHFLAENEYALLAEELGIDRIKESLAALKFILMSRIINSALIVLPGASLENERDTSGIGNDSGWLNKLKNLCPELPVSVIKGEDEERAQCWNKSASVYLTDQKTLLNDYRSKILAPNDMSRFDCMLFDEVQYWLNGSEISEEFLMQIKPRMLWALSSVLDNNFLSDLNNLLDISCRIHSYKTKRISDLDDEHPDISFSEFWLNLDEHQQVEYYETVKQCRKELKKILESENPFRFQANIYMLLHKLYQVENFAQGYETSPKTNLLLQHIQSIARSGNKVIILSQYDKQGTRKIEKFLEHNKINYINAPSSLSGEEIKKAVYLFKNKQSITAFLTNVKESRLNFEDMQVPYIIKFDSWWNPASNLQTKSMFQHKEKAIQGHKSFVFLYKVYGAIDEQVKRLLSDKNLIKQNMISAMSLNVLNDLINVDEWLEIFGMPIENKSSDRKKLIDLTVEKMRGLSLADFRATLSRFFFSLGYSKIDILEHENSASFDIAGEGKSGGRSVYLFGRVFIEENVSIKEIKQTVFDASTSKNNNIFIITRGKFEEGSEKYEKNNVMLIDTDKLAQFLVNINMIQYEDLESSEEVGVDTEETLPDEPD